MPFSDWVVLLACAAVQLGLPVAKVVQIVRAGREARSLDMPMVSDGGNGKGDGDVPMLIDTLADTTQESLLEEGSDDRCAPSCMGRLCPCTCYSCRSVRLAKFVLSCIREGAKSCVTNLL